MSMFTKEGSVDSETTNCVLITLYENLNWVVSYRQHKVEQNLEKFFDFYDQRGL